MKQVKSNNIELCVRVSQLDHYYYYYYHYYY